MFELFWPLVEMERFEIESWHSLSQKEFLLLFMYITQHPSALLEYKISGLCIPPIYLENLPHTLGLFCVG